MNSTRYFGGVLGACLLLGCGQTAPKQSVGSESDALVVPTQVNSFAVLATGHATFGDRSAFSGGDVGVAAGTGDSVTAGFDTQIALGNYTLGQRIVLKDRAHAGNLAATTVVPGAGASYATLVAYAAPPAAPPIVAFTAGTTPLQVNAPTTLAPGNFGLVTVNSTLTLSGGTYQFQNLTLGNNAVVQTTAPSVVRVAGRIAGGNSVRLLPTGSQPASALRLVVAGTTDTAGGVSLGTDARVTAIVVSRASFGAGDRFVGKGAIAARNFTVGTDTSFAFQAGIECNADTACDDHNPCTADACTDARCVHTALANGTACTDDGNVCTTDVCTAGTCNHAALADGSACSDDSNPCTSDTCSAGACAHPKLADGTSCGSAGGACGAGTCANVTCTGSGSNNSVIAGSAVVGGLAVTRNDTTAVQSDGSLLTDIVIAINGASVMHQTFSGPDASGALSEAVDYGAGIHGISHAEFFSDGSTVTGIVDGRALLPIAIASASDSSAIHFADGGALPSISVDPGVTEAVTAISSAVAAPTACGSSPMALELRPLDLPFGQPFVPAHTGSFPACSDCLGLCEGAYVGCDTAATAGCVGLALATAPIAWLTGGICGAAALYSCDRLYQSCTGSCRDPGKDCCPVRCTQGCCGTGDTCVNKGLPALCCDAGLEVCSGPKGNNCVDTKQAVCLPSGLACPTGTTICGTGADQICCTSGLCNGSQCVPSANFGIDVSVTTSAVPGYFELCSTGAGFTPGGHVSLSFGPLPGTDPNTPRMGYEFDGANVGADGTYSIGGQLSVNAIFCGDPNQPVVVTATDQVTGGTTTTNLPGRFFCNNGSQADYNGGCGI